MTDNRQDLSNDRVDLTDDPRDESAAETWDRPGPGGPASAGGPDPSDAPADLATVTRQRDEYYDRLLRQAAEFDNYRKRVERERRGQASQAASDVLLDLLPVVDDFERALQAGVSSPGAEAYRAGIEIIHKQLIDLLRKRGVTPIASVGHPFDPHFHQAVAQEMGTGRPDGEVVSELRRGYLIGDRLLRPAMVKVAKA